MVGPFQITNGLAYFGGAGVVAFIVRIVLSFLKALDERAWEQTYEVAHDRAFPYPDTEFWQRMWIAMKGGGTTAVKDMWLPFLIGYGEALAYPFLIAAGKPIVIMAWLGIKTAGVWGLWKESRRAFNRFLIGSMLVIFGAIWLARFIVVKG